MFTVICSISLYKVQLIYSFQCLCTFITSNLGFFQMLQQRKFSTHILLLMCMYCCCSVAQLCPTFCSTWTAAHQASLSFTISWSFLKLMSIESVMPSNHLIFCCPLLLSPVPPSIRVFSNESVLCIRWPNY